MNKDKIELEEAINLLKEMQKNALEAYNNLKGNYRDEKAKDKAEAIETLLQALENSIPTKKIEDKIKLIEMEEHYDYKINYTSKQVKKLFQELLENK